MKRSVKVDLSWKVWSLIVGFFILIGFVGLSFAYNSGAAPSVMGHSADEIEGSVSGLPAGADYVVTTWRSSDNTSWYRKYNSGWIEQGGISFANDYTAIDLPTAFTNNKYTLLLAYFGGNSTSEEKWTNTEYSAGMYVYGRTTTSFKKETSWTLTGAGHANRPVIFYASGF